MNINKINEDLINFWNKEFESLKAPEIIKSKELSKNPLYESFKYMGDHSESVLDFGCGSGFGIFTTYLHGHKIKYGLGIDTSKAAIDYCKETARLSNMESLSFLNENHLYLNNLEGKSFDGIICSNVLDVVPFETSSEMIKAMDRVLKDKGLLLIKLNFFLTDSMINKNEMKEVDKDTYTLNGILRGVNLTTDEWIQRFRNYEVLKIDSYQRLEKGPKDRIIFLKKLPFN